MICLCRIVPFLGHKHPSPIHQFTSVKSNLFCHHYHHHHIRLTSASRSTPSHVLITIYFIRLGTPPVLRSSCTAMRFFHGREGWIIGSPLEEHFWRNPCTTKVVLTTSLDYSTLRMLFGKHNLTAYFVWILSRSLLKARKSVLQ